jgi:hypothetical protein
MSCPNNWLRRVATEHPPTPGGSLPVATGSNRRTQPSSRERKKFLVRS